MKTLIPPHPIVARFVYQAQRFREQKRFRHALILLRCAYELHLENHRFMLENGTKEQTNMYAKNLDEILDLDLKILAEAEGF